MMNEIPVYVMAATSVVHGPVHTMSDQHQAHVCGSSLHTWLFLSVVYVEEDQGHDDDEHEGQDTSDNRVYKRGEDDVRVRILHAHVHCSPFVCIPVTCVIKSLGDDEPRKGLPECFGHDANEEEEARPEDECRQVVLLSLQGGTMDRLHDRGRDHDAQDTLHCDQDVCYKPHPFEDADHDEKDDADQDEARPGHVG